MRRSGIALALVAPALLLGCCGEFDLPRRPPPNGPSSAAPPDLLRSIEMSAEVGPLAATSNLGDHGSSNAVPTWSVTPLAGLQDRAGAATIVSIVGPILSSADQATLASADAVVVIAGTTGRTRAST